MERKSVYKVTVSNDDLTTVMFIANNKIDAIDKYKRWIKDNYYQGFIDEYMDFEIVFLGYAYE